MEILRAIIYAFKYVLPLEIVRDDGFSNILERRFKDLEFDIELESNILEAKTEVL